MPLHPRLLSGYGLIEAPFTPVLEDFGHHKRADQAVMKAIKVTTQAEEALRHLDWRTHPATRLLLVELGAWTALLTNERNGSDFADHQHWVGKTVRVPSIRVVDHPARWYQRDGVRERQAYEAHIVSWHDADDSVIRSIACMDDGGRWVFETAGTPLAVEQDFDYKAFRKRDRFGSSQMQKVLRAIGPGPLTESRFLAASRYALLVETVRNRTWRKRIEEFGCTLEESDDPALGYYRRGQGYLAHLETHAESVVHDYEKAIKINPGLEPRLRHDLHRAREVVMRRRR